ncbi:MAG: 2-C-methyl-D-erythritol 2,4-cyclodiphosphate synthase, partial [Gammaproteobacteria bacterium]
KGYKIGNADITILAQAPRLLSHIPSMRKILSNDMNIQLDEVNVKATTTEGMGYVGREEGIAVYSVVILIFT